MHLVYVFQDPFGAPDSKAGRTSSPDVRLGVYQNSYSSRSYVAQFDFAFYGAKRAIENLESAIKKEFDWDIELDGRGHSEWIWDKTSHDVRTKIQELIEGYRFKIKEVPEQFLPLTIHNLDLFEEYLEQEKQNG